MKIVKVISFFVILLIPVYVFSFKISNQTGSKVGFHFWYMSVLDNGNPIKSLELDSYTESDNLTLNPKDIKNGKLGIVLDCKANANCRDFEIHLNKPSHTTNSKNYSQYDLNSEETVFYAVLDQKDNSIKIIDLKEEEEKKEKEENEEECVIAPGGPDWKKPIIAPGGPGWRKDLR